MVRALQVKTEARPHPVISLDGRKLQPAGRPRPGGGDTLLSFADGFLMLFKFRVLEDRGLQPLAHSDRETARPSTENKGDRLVVVGGKLLDIERQFGAGLGKNDLQSTRRYCKQALTTKTSGRRIICKP